MTPSYTVIIQTPQELNHASYIQTGLFELEQFGLIKVKVKVCLKKNKGTISVDSEGNLKQTLRAQPKTSFYTLINTVSKQKITFATDLYDFAEHFSKVALNSCDFYFKRNFESRYVNSVQAIARAKIIKLGVTFGCSSKHKHDRYKFFIGLFLSNLYLNFKIDRSVLERLLKTYIAQKKHWQFTNTSRCIRRFEKYNKTTSNSIMFQTRCFLHENNIDVKQIHQQRYAIIKLLQKQFPKVFLGGFITSKLVNEKYKDAITNVPSEPEAYLDAMKNARIVVYTRGLANSPAWKMAEYLSQGKVIIAEPLTAQLPVPLEEGKELLYFNNESELIEKINMVLNNKLLADSLSKNARAYFETYIHPVQNVKRILEHMLNKPLA